MTSASDVRLLLVEDHPLVREAMRSQLIDVGFDVVATAVDGPSCVALYASLHPDVVLSDVVLPGFSGIEATRQVIAADPAARVLLISAVGDDRAIGAAMDAGAAGYVLKSVDADQLTSYVIAVYDGQRGVFDPATAERVAAHPPQSSTGPA